MTTAVPLEGSTALITGGAGLIGSTIADQLVHAGAERIILIDNLTRGRHANIAGALDSGRVELIEGDIRDRDLLARTFPGVDVVFHQAAIRITQCAEDPRLALEVLVDGTFDVIEAAVQADVKKVIAASSASVLGLAEEFPTTERHHPYNNRTIYGAAKAFNEGLLRSFNDMYGLDYVALRYFNVYGPRMDIHGVYTEVLIRWMERITEGTAPLIFGDGSQTMDFVFSADIARANLLAAQADVTDDVFNVASGMETSLDDLARTLLKVMGSDLQPEYGPERKVNNVSRRLASTSSAADRIGFRAEIDLEEGLRRLVDWWQGERAAGNESVGA
jgi:UDP-glucose 4-epimerase